MSTTTLHKANAEPRWLRWTLTGVGLGFLFLFLALPLYAVFFEALRGGWSAYLEALNDPEGRTAIWLPIWWIIGNGFISDTPSPSRTNSAPDTLVEVSMTGFTRTPA